MGDGASPQNPFAPPSEYADYQRKPRGPVQQEYRLASYLQRLAGYIIDRLLYVASMVPGALLAAAVTVSTGDDINAGLSIAGLAMLGTLVLAGASGLVFGLLLLLSGTYLTVYYVNEHYLTGIGL